MLSSVGEIEIFQTACVSGNFQNIVPALVLFQEEHSYHMALIVLIVKITKSLENG